MRPASTPLSQYGETTTAPVWEETVARGLEVSAHAHPPSSEEAREEASGDSAPARCNRRTSLACQPFGGVEKAEPSWLGHLPGGRRAGGWWTYSSQPQGYPRRLRKSLWPSPVRQPFDSGSSASSQGGCVSEVHSRLPLMLSWVAILLLLFLIKTADFLIRYYGWLRFLGGYGAILSGPGETT
eukprot:1309630-Rhodomonas_salina.1